MGSKGFKNLLVQAVALFALLALPAATFASQTVLRASVVDQYTEVVPTPDGGRLIKPFAAPEADPVIQGAPTGVGGASTGIEVVEQVLPNEQRARKRKAKPGIQKEQRLPSLAKESFESPAPPGGMGPLFPALLLLGFVASAGFMIGRRQGAGTRNGRR